MADGRVVNFEEFRAAREQRRLRQGYGGPKAVQEMPFLKSAGSEPVPLEPRQREHRFRMLGHLARAPLAGGA